MIIKDNMANMCAKVTSTYMEFTLALVQNRNLVFHLSFILCYEQIVPWISYSVNIRSFFNKKIARRLNVVKCNSSLLQYIYG